VLAINIEVNLLGDQFYGQNWFQYLLQLFRLFNFPDVLQYLLQLVAFFFTWDARAQFVFAVFWSYMPLTVNSRFKCLHIFVKYWLSLNIERGTWRMEVDHMLIFIPSTD